MKHIAAKYKKSNSCSLNNIHRIDYSIDYALVNVLVIYDYFLPRLVE